MMIQRFPAPVKGNRRTTRCKSLLQHTGGTRLASSSSAPTSTGAVPHRLSPKSRESWHWKHGKIRNENTPQRLFVSSTYGLHFHDLSLCATTEWIFAQVTQTDGQGAGAQESWPGLPSSLSVLSEENAGGFSTHHLASRSACNCTNGGRSPISIHQSQWTD